MKKYIKTLVLLLSVAFLEIGMSPRQVESQENQLLKYVPQDANLVILLNLEDSKNTESPLQSQIQDQFEQHAGHIPFYVPASIEKIVMAAEVEWSTMRSYWEVGVAEFKNAKIELNGLDDQISDKPCCVKNGIQFLRLDASKVGLIWPASRQKVARWIQSSNGQTDTGFSKYLAASLAPEKVAKNELVIALDLVDAIAPSAMRNVLAESAVFEKQITPIDEIAELFNGLKGARVAMKLGNPIHAELALDFTDNLQPLTTSIAKPLMLHLLKISGFGFPEFSDWHVSIDGTTLSMTGNLSETGIRQLTKLIAIDPGLLRSLKDDQSISETRSRESESSESENSKRYAKRIAQRDSRFFVQQVEQTVVDLNAGWRQNSFNLARRAFLVSQAAQRIQRLRSINVSSDLQEYAYQVAEKLHNISDKYQTAVLKSTNQYSGKPRSIQFGAIPYDPVYTPYETSFRYAPYAFWDVDLTGDEKANAQLAEAVEFSSKTFREIDSLVSEMKKEYQKQEAANNR